MFFCGGAGAAWNFPGFSGVFRAFSGFLRLPAAVSGLLPDAEALSVVDEFGDPPPEVVE